MPGEGNNSDNANEQAIKSDAQRLFIALAEQLKTPLTQIARSTELTKIDDLRQASLIDIESSAKTALNLIDSYLLSSEIKLNQQSMLLEPLSVQLILQEAAHDLEPLSQQYNCQVLVKNIGRNCPPVMANAEGLKSAITSIASVFIESTQNLSKKKRQISLVTHKLGDGVLTGVFSRANGLNNKALLDAEELYGRAKMPFALLNNSGAGIFVAKSLVEALSSELKFSRYANQLGLAAILPVSKQLKLRVN